MSNTKTFEGKPCGNCGSTIRYRRSGKCVDCAKASVRRSQIRHGFSRRTTAQEKVRAHDGTEVKVDPIWKMMGGK